MWTGGPPRVPSVDQLPHPFLLAAGVNEDIMTGRYEPLIYVRKFKQFLSFSAINSKRFLDVNVEIRTSNIALLVRSDFAEVL